MGAVISTLAKNCRVEQSIVSLKSNEGWSVAGGECPPRLKSLRKKTKRL